MEKKQKEKIAQESLQDAMQGGTPSVEELMNHLREAALENQKLKYQMRQMSEEYKSMQLRLGAEEYKLRTEYLWKVLFTEYSTTVFGDEFVDRCRDEFIEMMFPTMPEESTADKDGDA